MGVKNDFLFDLWEMWVKQYMMIIALTTGWQIDFKMDPNGLPKVAHKIVPRIVPENKVWKKTQNSFQFFVW